MTSSTNQTWHTKAKKIIDNLSIRNVLVFISILAVFGAVMDYWHESGLRLCFRQCSENRVFIIQLIPEFFRYILRNLWAEFVGIVIVALILDRLNDRLQDEERNEQLKKRLILHMASPTNEAALEAVRELHHKGWLYDGTLKNARFQGANLEKVILTKAVLEGADLAEANLEGAKLWAVNIEGGRLAGAKLKDANLYATNLAKANMRFAQLEKALSTQAQIFG